MGKLKTSAITYRRGVPNNSSAFFFVAQANWSIPAPVSKFRVNNVRTTTPTPPTPPTTPSAPTITSITPGDQSLLLNFTSPTSDGGSAITNYQYSIDAGTNYTSAGTTSSPITISGLTNGTTYPLRLRAVNSIGTGAESNILIGTPVSPTTFTFNGFSPITTTSSTISKATYLIGGRTEADLIEVSIGTSCTAIADDCFNFFNILPTNLASVTFLGNSVTSFGNYSFAYNSSPSSFNTITIPSSVTSIGENCFLYCEKLNGTITIPFSVTILGDGCFIGCQSLDRIIFEAGSTITSLPTSCFNGCSQLSTINIPASVTTIGNSTFTSCSSLIPGSITFDGTLVTSFIGSSFAYCTGLANLDFIPSSVTTLGPGIFLGCTGLADTIQIPSSIQNIGYACFKDCTNITTIVIPSSVNLINDNMMEGCTSLTTVIFKNQSTLTYIQEMLFSLTQNIQISFYLLSPTAEYSSLSAITKSYFIDPPPPPTNWTYYYSTNPSPY
jgi:hypothetical protein